MNEEEYGFGEWGYDSKEEYEKEMEAKKVAEAERQKLLQQEEAASNKPRRKDYDVINSSFKKDFIPTEEELAKINSFFMCRTIANHPVGVLVANYINSNYSMDVRAQYWLIRSSVHSVKNTNNGGQKE